MVHGRNLEHPVRATLPREASKFNVELSAIQQALVLIRESVPLNWTILSDSQASIQAIAHPKPKHPLVRSIQSSLIELQNLNKRITFCKVPSQVGVRGNEAADRVAKEALEIPGVNTTLIPHRDHHPPPIRNYIMTVAVPMGPHG